MTTNDEYLAYYEAVYGRDTSDDQPHGWIQWKGTRPCIDLHCACGHHCHADGDFFFYNWQCHVCGRKYALGQVVKLIELSADEAAYVSDGRTCGFVITPCGDEEQG